MSSVRPGDVLAGKYRVERVLGSGGMGYVVAARHLQLDQLVAMKFLRRSGGASEQEEATGRFLREAKAVVRLKNEHVAKVFDVGTLENDEPYIVMEYLDGCDLSALAKKRGAIPVSEATDYLMQACEALAEAHSLGIIHRDVKLANLFVTRGPAGAPLVKVLDFGISKVNTFGESEHEMTAAASMLGSPRFMSPEQMRDPRAVDARSDIWSLGVVLYRLVAGKPPFEADTLGRLLTMVMHEHPDPLAAVRSDLPPGFSEAVMRCLEKDPHYRYPNIAELAYALSPYAADPHRARQIADRIAATLSVAQMPCSIEMLLPSVPVAAPSNPRSAVISVGSRSHDTGTAAPWTGTRGDGGLEPRNGLIWAAMALVATLGVGGIYAKIRHDHAQEAVAAAAAGSVGPILMAQPTIVQPVPLTQSTIAPVSVAQPETEAPAAPPPNVAVNPPSIAVSSLPSVLAELPRARSSGAPAHKPVRQAGGSSPSPVKPGDGIPSTRH